MSRDTERNYISLKEDWTPVINIGRLADLNANQEQFLRQYARDQGYTDLRRYRASLRRQRWTYYDVLKESPTG